MIKELQILVEVEKSLKILETMDVRHQSVSDIRHQGVGDLRHQDVSNLRHHLENIRNLQLQSFVENETYNFVLADALQIKEKSNERSSDKRSDNEKRSYVQTATYVSRH